MIETWQLRARFARNLAVMYGREVPAYTTLVEVTEQVNAEFAVANPQRAQRFGSLERVGAERHGAIRVGSPSEMRSVAVVFAAFGMYPVGFYDLRTAKVPVPVVSTAFRPTDPDELARNPFRVFTSMLATRDAQFFDADLRARLENFLAERTLFRPDLLELAHAASARGGLAEPDASRLVELASAAFALSDEPIDRGWYTELERVSAVAADIGGVRSTHINHLTPRVLDIDALYQRMSERGIAMIDRIQGPPQWSGPDVLLRQTSFRALQERRRFRETDGSVVDGTLRVRFGEVEARGIALTPAGRDHYDRLNSLDAPVSAWEKVFPRTESRLEAEGLAYFTYRATADGIVAEPIVYEDFLPRSAAGIFQSNLDSAGGRNDHTEAAVYDRNWLAEAIGMDVHDPYELYRQQQERSRATALAARAAGRSENVTTTSGDR